MKQPIIFAFYKNNKLIGYRLDTFGSIGLNSAKIYGAYSHEQVETVLKNIEYTLKNGSGFGKALGIEELAKMEEQIHKSLQDKGVFEVRVLKGPEPIYEKIFDVNKACYEISVFPSYDLGKWLSLPEHEVIEKHYFGMTGRINLQ